MWVVGVGLLATRSALCEGIPLYGALTHALTTKPREVENLKNLLLIYI